MIEPEPEWQNTIHAALLNHDKFTAFRDLCTEAIPHLERHLKHRFPNTPSDERYDVIVELLYSYQDKPEQFQPEKSSLFTYLRMAAEGDMLNLLAKVKRELQRTAYSLDDDEHEGVEDQLWDGNISVEEMIALKLRIQEIIPQLPLDDIEEAVLTLILAGEHTTSAFAEVMGLAQEEEVTQARRVKQMKDKLIKRLRRLQLRLRDDTIDDGGDPS
jgi:DNA-directed RNA polymerase specialized sigma24 family protein